MPTIQNALRLAKLSIDDKTSAKRLREILRIARSHDLFRHGLTPEKAVAVLQDLGPTFVKLGQIASTHPDVLPQEYCDAFAQLRANVAPMTMDEVDAQLEAELGQPASELFATFDETPLGSASIAQVHRATLDDGTVVAVKVQRPEVVELTAKDLMLMRHLLATYEFFDPDDNQISVKQLVDELERSSKEELDFLAEAENLSRFHANNAHREHVTSPRSYEEYTTNAVLTMDFASGPRVGDEGVVGRIDAARRDQLARLVARNYVQQIVEDGFFHADPHAGNLLVDGDGEGVEWIDFGMMGSLNSREREVVKKLMVAIAKEDAYGLKRALLQLVRTTGAVDHAALLAQCDTLVQQYCNADLDSFNTGSLLQDLVTSLQGNGFEFPPSVLMLARGLVTLEGTVRLLSGEVSVVGVLADYMKDAIDPMAEFEKRMRNLAASSVESVGSLASLPTKASETLDMLQQGQVKLEMNLGFDKTFRKSLASNIDHFTFAVIAAALFLGSCILCLTDLRPQILGVPLFGIIAFVGSLVIALLDFMAMLRDSNRRK